MISLIRGVTDFHPRRAAWSKPLLLMSLMAICLFTFCQEAEAGPGGQFAKQLFSSKFGRIGGLIVGGLLLILVVLLSPLFIYVWYAKKSGIRKTKEDLTYLASKYRWFDWP